jgi:peptidyl-tRNA hydrolase, PTH2 family
MKQVIIIRKDLNMRKGKMVAQGAHASLAVFFDRIIDKKKKSITISVKPVEFEWINGGFTKVCVGVNSEEELVEIYREAKKLSLPSSLITDSGKTEFQGEPTKTAAAIGPGEDRIIDKITGDLGLL